MTGAVTPHVQLTYGGILVPYTVSWTSEEAFSVAPCRHADDRLSICQTSSRGVGKPQFGKPHAQRQREAISRDLCDLCGRSLRNSTKVSLSHARPRRNAAAIGDILQVEPLLHKECAAKSVTQCPSLKKDLTGGSLNIRQVTRHRTQLAIMDEIYTAAMAGQAVKAVGHAKVQLLRWVDRDYAWLTASVAS